MAVGQSWSFLNIGVFKFGRPGSWPNAILEFADINERLDAERRLSSVNIGVFKKVA